MLTRLRRTLVLACAAVFVTALLGLLFVQLGRPLYYTDGERAELGGGAGLRHASMLAFARPEPLWELPGPVRGRVIAMPDGQLLYGRALSEYRTALVRFDPRRPQLAPEEVAALASRGHDLGPALSPDGRFLYFASDRQQAGGGGGFDLYRAAFDGVRFARPQPVPGGANGPDDEIDPVIDPRDGRVVFARRDSDGRSRLWTAAVDASAGDDDARPLFASERRATRLQPAAQVRDPWFDRDGRCVWFAHESDGEGSRVLRAVRHGEDWSEPMPALATSVADQDAFRAPVLMPAGDGGLPELWLLRARAPLLYRAAGIEMQPWWPGQAWIERLLWLVALLSLLVLVLLLLGGRWRTFDLITWCLLLSLLLHALVLLWLAGVEIVRQYTQPAPRPGQIEVTFVAAGALGDPAADNAQSLARELTFSGHRQELQATPPAPSAAAAAPAPTAADARPPTATLPAAAADAAAAQAQEPALADAASAAFVPRQAMAESASEVAELAAAQQAVAPDAAAARPSTPARQAVAAPAFEVSVPDTGAGTLASAPAVGAGPMQVRRSAVEADPAAASAVADVQDAAAAPAAGAVRAARAGPAAEAAAQELPVLATAATPAPDAARSPASASIAATEAPPLPTAGVAASAPVATPAAAPAPRSWTEDRAPEPMPGPVAAVRDPAANARGSEARTARAEATSPAAGSALAATGALAPTVPAASPAAVPAADSGPADRRQLAPPVGAAMAVPTVAAAARTTAADRGMVGAQPLAAPGAIAVRDEPTARSAGPVAAGSSLRAAPTPSPSAAELAPLAAAVPIPAAPAGRRQSSPMVGAPTAPTVVLPDVTVVPPLPVVGRGASRRVAAPASVAAPTAPMAALRAPEVPARAAASRTEAARSGFAPSAPGVAALSPAVAAPTPRRRAGEGGLAPAAAGIRPPPPAAMALPGVVAPVGSAAPEAHHDVATPDLYRNRFGVEKVAALERFGGSQETEAAVRDGLAYLARIQRSDGGWGRRRRGHESYGEVHVGKSALCVLAFLGAGHVPGGGSEHANVVENAVDWLLAQQDPDTGHFGDTSSYSHGITTYALAECYAMSKLPRVRAPLERAVRWILRNQSRSRDRRNKGGWPYFSGTMSPEDGFSRTSVSSWMVMALESARASGIDVPPNSLPDARAFLWRMFDQRAGNFLYNQEPSRLRMSWRTLPASTPAAVFCLLLLGESPEDPRLREAMAWTVERAPSDYRRYSENDFVLRAAGNVYYWYYGTLASFLAGGEAWQQWNAQLKQVLLAGQAEDGSFPPIDVYAEYAEDTPRDAAHTTAMCVLSLEVYYRYFTPLLERR